MKKLLRLGDASAAGGRQVWQVYDLLGMRAIIQPRTDLAPVHAEAAAIEACYLVQELAQEIWPTIADREKDYITNPKGNGYRSIHISLQLPGVPDRSSDAAGGDGSSPGAGAAAAQGNSRGQARPYAYADTPLPANWLDGSSPVSGLPLVTPIVLQPLDTSTHPTTTHGSSSSGGSSAADTSTSGNGSSSDSSRSEGSSSNGSSGSAYASFQPESPPHSASQQRPPVREEDLLLSGPCVELQIRTVSMDEAAESGDAAHTAYKGGLDSRQSRQLQAWTRQLQARVYLPGGKGLLLAAAAITNGSSNNSSSTIAVPSVDASSAGSSWVSLTSDPTSEDPASSATEAVSQLNGDPPAAVVATVVVCLTDAASHNSDGRDGVHLATASQLPAGALVLQAVSILLPDASASLSSCESHPLETSASPETAVCSADTVTDSPAVTHALPSKHTLVHSHPLHPASQPAHTQDSQSSPVSPHASPLPIQHSTTPAHPGTARLPPYVQTALAPDATSTPYSRLFAHLDRNSDGTLSLEELSLVLSELGAGGVEEARQLMLLLDDDGDGIVTLQEFTELHRKVGLGLLFCICDFWMVWGLFVASQGRVLGLHTQKDLASLVSFPVNRVDIV